jgi:hypothetical protein
MSVRCYTEWHIVIIQLISHICGLCEVRNLAWVGKLKDIGILVCKTLLKRFFVRPGVRALVTSCPTAPSRRHGIILDCGFYQKKVLLMLTACLDTEVWCAAPLEQACKPFFLYESPLSLRILLKLLTLRKHMCEHELDFIIVSSGGVWYERLKHDIIWS